MAKSKIHVTMIREGRSHLIKGMVTLHAGRKERETPSGKDPKTGVSQFTPRGQMEKKSAHEDLMCME